MKSIIICLAVISIFVFLSFQTDVRSRQHGDHSKIQLKTDASLVKDARYKIIKAKYTCPMHPEVISDQPGKCPKCGMTLVKVKSLPIIKRSQKMQKDTTMSHSKKMH